MSQPDKVLRAKRRRLFRNLLAAGMSEPQARRVAAAVHAPGAAAKRAKQQAATTTPAGLWVPPTVRSALRAQLTPLDRLAVRLMDSLRLTSEVARQMAEQSFRRCDAKAEVPT